MCRMHSVWRRDAMDGMWTLLLSHLLENSHRNEVCSENYNKWAALLVPSLHCPYLCQTFHVHNWKGLHIQICISLTQLAYDN